MLKETIVSASTDTFSFSFITCILKPYNITEGINIWSSNILQLFLTNFINIPSNRKNHEILKTHFKKQKCKNQTTF